MIRPMQEKAKMKQRTILALAFGCLAALLSATGRADEGASAVAKVGGVEYTALQVCEGRGEGDDLFEEDRFACGGS